VESCKVCNGRRETGLKPSKPPKSQINGIDLRKTLLGLLLSIEVLAGANSLPALSRLSAVLSARGSVSYVPTCRRPFQVFRKPLKVR
jgi:hypothetical protein